MRLYLADYGIDMDVYGYWLWRYYPEWLVWWQNNASQANQETQDSTATAEGAAPAVESAQGESATAVLPQLCIPRLSLHVCTTSDKVAQDEMPGAIPSNGRIFWLGAKW